MVKSSHFKTGRDPGMGDCGQGTCGGQACVRHPQCPWLPGIGLEPVPLGSLCPLSRTCRSAQESQCQPLSAGTAPTVSTLPPFPEHVVPAVHQVPAQRLLPKPGTAGMLLCGHCPLLPWAALHDLSWSLSPQAWHPRTSVNNPPPGSHKQSKELP